MTDSARVNEYCRIKFNRLIESNIQHIKNSEYGKEHYSKNFSNINYMSSLATAVTAIMEYNKIDVTSAINALTDGSDDNKIDLLYFDEENIEQIPNSDEKIMDLIIVQAKYCSSREIVNTFSQDEISACLKTVNKIQNGDSFDKTNFLLSGKFTELQHITERNDFPTLRVHVYFATNGIISDALKQSSDIEEANKNDVTIKFIDATNFGLKEDVPETATIKILSGQQLEQVLTPSISGFISETTLENLVKFYQQNHEKALLNNNVRYLLSKSKINTGIVQTASYSPELFWFFNNGVTIVAEDYTVRSTGAKNKTHNLTMKNPSIVNGGQTTAILSKMQHEKNFDKQLKTAKVLLRVYKTKDPDIVLQIAQATNSQNPISIVNLKANNTVQKKVKDHFKSKGVALIVKPGEDLTDYNDSITNENLLQAYVAMFLKEPAKAKVSRIAVFNQYFDSVFSEKELDSGISNKLYNCYVIWKKIKTLSTSDPLYAHAIYSIMYILGLLKPILTNNTIARNEIEKHFDENIKQATKIIQNIADKKREELGSRFSYNNLFKSSEIKDLIDLEIQKQTN